MKIKLLVIGKTDDKSLQSLMQLYEKRIKGFVGFDFDVIPDIKNTKKLSENQQKQKEGDLLLAKLNTSDYVVLLDEKGKEFTSVKFAAFLQKQMNSGIKQLVFIIGGPYGFSQAVYQRANQKIALSQMTFSHQMVRLIFLEQLYRGYAIINHHPYHHV
jgi:23S rRNA (pseudouridine1915-N3)-methyltransferase